MANTIGSSGGGGSSPSSLLDRARGKSLTDLAKTGFGAWLLAVSTSVITGTQELLNLLIVTPIDVITTVMRESGAAFFVEPLSVISEGATASARGAGEFGVFGLIVAVLVVLGAYRIVTWYLSDDDTSDLIPAGGLDVVPFVGGAEEDEDEG